jgi:hypothetical protein
LAVAGDLRRLFHNQESTMTDTDALAKARAAKAAKAAERAEETKASDKPATAPEMVAEPAAEPAERLSMARTEHVATPKPVAPDAMPKAEDDIGKLVEVELTRPYVPKFIENDMGELVRQGEIKAKLPVGTVLKLPKDEATRALNLHIATATPNTFA